MHHGKISEEIALGLKELGKRIDKAKIPPSKLDETLNLATWNIREFGKKSRLKASLHYIAEVLGQFDLIAVVEVRDNLADLAEVLHYLGPYWKAVFSDYITDSGGNRERVAYIYDKRAVVFNGLAAEAEPPRTKNQQGEYVSQISWWRSPYLASFRAGDFDFILITAHIRWDAKGGEQSRIKELKLLADWVEKRRKEKYVEDKDIIVMGDFNIPKIDDALFQAVTKNGLRIPDKLRGTHGSNLARDKRYDQILYYQEHTAAIKQASPAGVMDYYEGGIDKLYPDTKLTKEKFTYQMSDHLPLWVQLNVDIDEEKLDQLIQGK